MSETVGVLHDPVSGNARRVTVVADTTGLRLSAESVDRQVRWPAVSVSGGGWDGRSLHLTWEEEAGQTWALTLDADAARLLAPSLPAGLAVEVGGLLQTAGRHEQRRRLTLPSIAFVFVVLPLLALLSVYLMRDRLIDAVLRRLPTSVDTEVGQLVHTQVTGSKTLVKDGPAVDAVRLIGSRVAAAAPPHTFTFRFEVIRDPTLNAFAAPGGVVVVHTGLLAAAESADEVAGVLAHEVTHVLHRHSMRQMVFAAGLGGAFQLLVGSPEGAVGALTGAALDLTSLSYGRDQERDADRGGLDLLQQAKLPPQGMVSFFKKLKEQGGTPPAFLSSHPPSEERMQGLADEIARRGAWTVEPLTVDWAAVRASAGGK